MAQLYDLITATDRAIGQILKRLDDDGLADDTIVFFWSDHGDGLPRAKRWLYDSGVHAPLIVRFPDKWRHLAPSDPGTTNGDLVAMIDLGPTVLSLGGVTPPSHMQGRAFLGEHRAPPRPYVFGGRDRMDETYDLIRYVRDHRYKYIRNYEPSLPYAQVLEYAEHMPTLKAWRRESAAGTLTAPRQLYMQPNKPLEELYDTLADPWEIDNLAASPEHRDALNRLRAELERWQLETGDLGLLPESQLWDRVKPGGLKQTTADPSTTLRHINDTLFVELTCPTPGSLIAYTTDAGSDPHWLLYTSPIPLAPDTTLRARANRIGYADSAEISLPID